MKIVMSLNPDEYTQAAAELIQQIRQQSAAAAQCLELIQARNGVRAAYLAAFALIILKGQAGQMGYPSLDEALKVFTFYDEMQEDSESIRLYEQAAHLLLE